MFFQGVIQATGIGANNLGQPTGAFAIPTGAKAIYLQPDTTGVQWQMFTASQLASGSMGAFLPGPNIVAGPFICGAPKVYVSVINTAGGLVKVRVFTAPTS
jgi:hypothetical protein